VSNTRLNPYLNKEWVRAAAESSHRVAIGGLWEELGALQLRFLVSQGLRPEHFLLDVGCGSFRGGVALIPYLQPGHYYGLDLVQDLVDVGYAREIIPAGLADRFPPENIVTNDRFDAQGFSRKFDFAIAQSVFTHVPWNDVRLCLEETSAVMQPGGVLYATYFHLKEGERSGQEIKHHPGGIITNANRDPYHYKISDFEHACKGLPWTIKWHGTWEHPRAQRMICFARDAA
jgi:SAM-dependent methyltransferase